MFSPLYIYLLFKNVFKLLRGLRAIKANEKIEEKTYRGPEGEKSDPNQPGQLIRS